MAADIATTNTARSVKFWVPGIPVAWHVEARVVRNGNGIFGQLYQRARLRNWKRLVSSMAARSRAPRLLAGPVAVRFVFVMKAPSDATGSRGGSAYLRRLVPTTKPDLTNLVKAAEDAMSGVIYDDDRQVVDSHSRKIYADPAVNQGPGVWVSVRELTGEDILRIVGRNTR